jgi:hypothetical protein
MPQKKNPDAAELVRAKIGRVMGAFTALMTVMKGLPMAYAKDMQEDKEPIFDALETLELTIAATTGMVADMVPNAKGAEEGGRLGLRHRHGPCRLAGAGAEHAVPRCPPCNRLAAAGLTACGRAGRARITGLPAASRRCRHAGRRRAG